MAQYIGVKFRTQGQVYFFSCEKQEEIQPGDLVLVRTEEGRGLAHVVTVKDSAPQDLDLEGLKEIERKASEDDFQVQQENQSLGQEALEFCRQKVRELALEMKLVDVEVRFDQSKIVFYFTAPSRIDFRELVKLLVGRYRTRIELRQIGVRHEAQIMGGIGSCGRVCCCHQFMRRFEPVTIKMAKEQQLFLNPSKISGSCGRLLCCLNFERANYDDFKRKCPKIGKKYQTPDGEYKVLRANLFRDSLVVSNQEGQELEMTLPEWAEFLEGNDNNYAEEQEQNNQHSQHPAKAQAQQNPGAAQPKNQEGGAPRAKAKAKQSVKPQEQKQEAAQAQEGKASNPGKAGSGKGKKRRSRSKKKKK
ncbi:MAG: stage 0 sporulation family protein [Desulfohalobiaceae bacterium]